ncbi:MAG: D-tyrosyl-tRNA(Tyr) deacylase [Psychrilyobacter sp.]|nr:D-tyrosyl-tRNA(Tyr) deacylase [Psychrilyobacter sp.]
MRVVLQRVTRASVEVNEKVIGKIKNGLVVLLGIHDEDNMKELDWMVNKIIGLRIFEDENGKMNHSLIDIEGDLLIISQFTLYGNCEKGRRPGFTDAARPEKAIPMYEEFINKCRGLGVHVETGEFGADMKVDLLNDGPVTLIIDSPTRLRS